MTLRSMLSRTAVFGSAIWLAGCTTSAAPTGEGASAPRWRPTPPNTLGITAAGQLPDPCALVSGATVRSLIGVDPTDADEREGPIIDDQPMLFRTCQWGGDDRPEGTIAVQIGVANAAGRDVIYNRSLGLEPALESPVGTDGRETMNVALLPTGGRLGSTVFFRSAGYSIIIGHAGPGAAQGTVRALAGEAITSLGGG